MQVLFPLDKVGSFSAQSLASGFQVSVIFHPESLLFREVVFTMIGVSGLIGTCSITFFQLHRPDELDC